MTSGRRLVSEISIRFEPPRGEEKQAIKIFSGLLVGFYYLMVVCWLAGSRP